jgi:hypothetical protein
MKTALNVDRSLTPPLIFPMSYLTVPTSYAITALNLQEVRIITE